MLISRANHSLLLRCLPTAHLFNPLSTTIPNLAAAWSYKPFPPQRFSFPPQRFSLLLQCNTALSFTLPSQPAQGRCSSSLSSAFPKQSKRSNSIQRYSITRLLASMPEHNSATPYQCLSVPAPYFAVKTLPLPCESQLFLSRSPLSFAIVSHHNPITMIFCSVTNQNHDKTTPERCKPVLRYSPAYLRHAFPWHIFSTPTPNKAFPLQIGSLPSPNNSVPLPHGASPSQLLAFP